MKENIIDKILNLHSDLKIVCYYKQYLFVENRYGICKVQKYSLLSGSKPTISTAVNKTSYFINQLFEKQPNIVVVSDYKGALMQIIVKDRYGFCESTPNRLLSGQIPCIETAIDKTDYFINQSKSIHEERYDYTNTVYINSKTKVKVICQEHGQFEQLPGHHLVTNGCLSCGHKTKNGGNFYNNKENFNKSCIMYILKFSNEKETFFKFGVSVNFKKRIKSINTDCKSLYNIEIVKQIANTVEYCFRLEYRFKKKIWKSRRTYIPIIKFGGMYECFI